MERIVNWIFILLFASLAFGAIKIVLYDLDAVNNCKAIGATAVKTINGGYVCVKEA